MEYADFEIKIETQRDDHHTVSVIHTPAGEARATMQFGLTEAELRAQLQQLEQALDANKEMTKSDEEAVTAFGQMLFESLMRDEFRSLYDRSQLISEQQGKGLRLKLRIPSPQLASMPWELLYDRRIGDYVSLSRNTSIVRYIELPRAVKSIEVAPPLHILGVVSSPKNLFPLDVALEKQRVEQATAALRQKGLVELTWLERATWRDLMRAMRRGPWHIFHYIGHSGFDPDDDQGYISFCDSQGNEARLDATQLARLLKDHRTLQLALLNSCQGAKLGEDIFSSTATTLVRQGIPCVVAMQYDVSDEAAIEFANTFYELLAEEMPVETAIANARVAISFAIGNAIEWATPVFYTHAPDSVLFQLPESIVNNLDRQSEPNEIKVTSTSTLGIPPELNNRLREVLLNCGPFAKDEELQNVFTDTRIALWRSGLPEAENDLNRVESTLQYLVKSFNVYNENGLVLFLRVIGDRIHPQDACQRQIAELADELGGWFRTFQGVPSERIPVLYEKPGIVGKLVNLFGRDELVAEIADLLIEGKKILLYGPGGVGKTTVAIATGEQWLSTEANRVIWLEIGDEDASLIFDALAQSFGNNSEKLTIQRHIGNLEILTVQKMLARFDSTLLVLDNVWNGPALYRILQAIPAKMPVLVTSRLAYSLEEMRLVEDLGERDALRLLSHHADKNYEADEGANMLCRTLGFHPYALEIAGTILRVDKRRPRQLLGRIADAPQRIAMPGELTSPDRLSVSALLDVSYSALDSEDKIIFEAVGALLAVGTTPEFLAHFTGQSVDFVWDSLDRLTRRSLAKRREITVSGTKEYIDFYTFHDLTHSYVRALYVDKGNTIEAFLQSVTSFVDSHAQDLDQLHLNIANILAAAKLTRTKDIPHFLKTVETLALQGYVDSRGHTLDFMEMLDSAIELLNSEDEEEKISLHFLLGKQGNAYFNRGDWTKAKNVYSASLVLAPDNDRRSVLTAVLGEVCYRQEQYAEGESYFEQGYELAQKLDNDYTLGLVLQKWGVAMGVKGDFETARRYAFEAVQVAAQFKEQNPIRYAYSLLNLGSSEDDLGNIDKALILHKESLEIAQRLGHHRLEANLFYALGWDYHKLNNKQEAKRSLHQAKLLFQEIGDTNFEREVDAFINEHNY